MTPQNPLSYFVQALGMGQAEKDALIAHAVRANLKTISVMDDFGLCRQLKDALPDCIVVFRSSTFEPAPSADNARVIRDFLNGISSQDKRIVVMVNCEAGWNLDRVNMWSDMIIEADKLGWKLCVGNTSCGSIKCGQSHDPNDWITTGKRLLEVLLQHPGHYYGCHNYSGPFLWLVSNSGWGDPHKPPEKIDWTLPQWHMGREAQGIMAACKLLGLGKLLEREFMLITEGPFDQMADTETNLDNPYHSIKSNRWQMLIPHWQQWYPGVASEDVLANQAEWAWDKIYGPLKFVAGFHFFTWRSAGPEWEGDRVDNAPQYQKRMEAYRPAVSIPVPPPAPPPVPAPPPAPIPPSTPPADPIIEAVEFWSQTFKCKQSEFNMLKAMGRDVERVLPAPPLPTAKPAIETMITGG
jgi:hypothetical protein